MALWDLSVYKCLHGAKEGDREGNRERDGEWEKDRDRGIYTQFEGGSINGPSNRRRVELTVKLDELLWPSMTYSNKIFAYS